MSKTFEFSFIVSGIDPHSDDYEDRIIGGGCDDATLMLSKGSIVVTFAREEKTYIDAVVSAYSNLLSIGLEIERFAPDFLVTPSDIVERTGLSRQCINNYVKGERGENFPAPIMRVTTPSPLWDWVDVSRWLHKNGKVDQPVVTEAVISRVANTFITNNAAKVPQETLMIKKMEREVAFD